MEDREMNRKNSGDPGMQGYEEARGPDGRLRQPRSGAPRNPRAIGSDLEGWQRTEGLTDVEIVQRQVLHFYD